MLRFFGKLSDLLSHSSLVNSTRIIQHTILAVDVDDITIARNSPRAIQRFKNDLSSKYGIKDIGIKIKRDREKRMISFSQTTSSRR